MLVCIHHCQRAGDKEAETTLSDQNVRIEDLNGIECLIVVVVGEVDHVLGLIFVGGQPAAVLLQFGEGH